MFEFKEGQIVKIISKPDSQDEFCYGSILSVGDGTVVVNLHDTYETKIFSFDEVEYMPPKLFGSKDLKRILRFEMPAEEFMDGTEPGYNFVFTDYYEPTLADCKAALKKIREDLFWLRPRKEIIQSAMILSMISSGFVFSRRVENDEAPTADNNYETEPDADQAGVMECKTQPDVCPGGDMDCKTEPDAGSDVDCGYELHAVSGPTDDHVYDDETDISLAGDRDYIESYLITDKERLIPEVLSWIRSLADLSDEEAETVLTEDNISNILTDMNRVVRGTKVYAWKWSDVWASEFINGLKDRDLEFADEEHLDLIRNETLRLCKAGNVAVLERTAWFYYGGSRLFPCDWEKSRDIFLRLMKSKNRDDRAKCFYANSLGYIFYYGRCNDGKPEYSKAFKYFSIGAAGGVYESIYKLSDMFYKGYGIPENKLAAETLLDFVYNDCRKSFYQGAFDSQFADILLRKGNFARDKGDDRTAYYYYTVADFAIRKRLKFDHYGDSIVFTGIQKELSKIREKRPLENESGIEGLLPLWLHELFHDSTCKVRIVTAEEHAMMEITRLPNPDSEETEKFICCVPELGYCDLADFIREYAAGVTDFWTKGFDGEFIADSYKWEKAGESSRKIIFTHHGETTGMITAKMFFFPVPKKDDSKTQTHHFVSVCFTKGGKEYDYIADGFDVKVEDKVIVTANGKETEVEVVKVFDMNITDLPLSIEKYKKINKIVK